MSTVSWISFGIIIISLFLDATSIDNKCDNFGCSENCIISTNGPYCYCREGRVLDPEDKKTCKDPSPYPCDKEEISCMKNSLQTCISVYSRCDNVSDCDNSEDEWNCGGHQCPKGDDHRCGNGACFPKSARCNRETDCQDGSDEKDCNKCENFGCSHECAVTPSGPHCICPNEKILDRKDKKTCKDPSTYLCEKGQLPCIVSEVETCMSEYSRCDNRSDCDDSLDEKNCEGHQCPKGDDDYRCGNGACIPREAVCDRKKDCKDGSDEKDACDYSFIPCLKKNEHLCDNRTCVPALSVCDRIKDCEDGTDEEDCAFRDSEFIFFNEGPDVYKQEVITKSGVEYTSLLNVSLNKAAIITGLSFDVKRQILFISDAAGPAIYSVNVSSSQEQAMKDLVRDNIVYPVDIEFDWSSDNLYWVDSVKGTVQIVNVNTLMRLKILKNLKNPIAIALSPITGTMFILTSSCISTYAMDGLNARFLRKVQGSPSSLALHPYKTLLYWTDTVGGEILYADYSTSSDKGVRKYSILTNGLPGIMSLTVGFNDVFHTIEDADEKVSSVKFGEYQKNRKWKSIASTFGMRYTGKSECLVHNGGCAGICVTAQYGRVCRSLTTEFTSYSTHYKGCQGMPS